MKRYIATVAVGLLLTGSEGFAQRVTYDWKTAKIITENTGMAMTGEGLYRQQNDTIKSNTTNILSSVLLRQTMKSLDMQARLNRKGFRRESRSFYRLVNEVNNFVYAAKDLLTEAYKNPHHSVFVTRQTSKLLLEGKNLVKYAVVVAMNGRVPNPFKISVDSLEKDLATVPDYIYDAEKDSLMTDGLNLLLPDDRIAILNETIRRLRTMRRTMNVMYWKLKTDFNVRNLIWTANRADGRLYDKNIAAINQLKSNIERANGLW